MLERNPYNQPVTRKNHPDRIQAESRIVSGRVRFMSVLLLFVFTFSLMTWTGTAGWLRSDQVHADQNPSVNNLRLAAGYLHSALIHYDGQLYLWGDNTYGQLGMTDQPYVDRPTPVALPEPAAEVSLGTWHSLVLTQSGAVYAFGRNAFGQLGTGTTDNTSVPTPVTGLPQIKAIAAGSYHSLALGQDGSVWAWGNNTNHQVGDFSSEEITQPNGQTIATRVVLPVQVAPAGSATAIAAGGHFSMYLSADGQVWAWGDNNKGQLGDGTTQEHAQPAVIPNLTGVSRIAAGYEHALVLAESEQDGTDQILVWGDHSLGQLGTSVDSSATYLVHPTVLVLPAAAGKADPEDSGPTAHIVGIQAGYAQSSALVENAGTPGRQYLYVWGSNSHGQLGHGHIASQFTPVVMAGEYDGYQGNNFLPFEAIAWGGSHLLVMSSKGQLAAAGQGDRGQLGTATVINREQLTYVETPDLIRPDWADGQSVHVSYDEKTSELSLSWPQAQDNLVTTDYKVHLLYDDGTETVEAAGNTLSVKIPLRQDTKAVQISVYASDAAGEALEITSLNALRTYYLANAEDSADHYFANTDSTHVQVTADWLYSFAPDLSGQRQPLEVPWSQLSIYGEEIARPGFPWQQGLISVAIVLLGLAVFLTIRHIILKKKRADQIPSSKRCKPDAR